MFEAAGMNGNHYSTQHETRSRSKYLRVPTPSIVKLMLMVEVANSTRFTRSEKREARCEWQDAVGGSFNSRTRLFPRTGHGMVATESGLTFHPSSFSEKTTATHARALTPMVQCSAPPPRFDDHQCGPRADLFTPSDHHSIPSMLGTFLLELFAKSSSLMLL